jgi:hypothetical protein
MDAGDVGGQEQDALPVVIGDVLSDDLSNFLKGNAPLFPLDKIVHNEPFFRNFGLE